MAEVLFGEWVKLRRHFLGLTQTELGRRAGCAAITIRKIEAGDLHPSREVAAQLAEHLNVTGQTRGGSGAPPRCPHLPKPAHRATPPSRRVPPIYPRPQLA
jgi:transcriptional regulator with XRE-family HTH domain